MTCGSRSLAYPTYSSTISSASTGNVLYTLGRTLFFSSRSCLDLLTEDLDIEEILDPDSESSVFVGVGGTDPLFGRPDLVLTEVSLDGGVEFAVIRHDQVSVGGQPNTTRIEAFRLGHVHLGEKNLGVDHGPGCDDRSALRVQNPGRDQRECQLFITHNDGVSSVVATLVSDHVISRLREVVDNTSFTFIAPLSTQNNCGWHDVARR